MIYVGQGVSIPRTTEAIWSTATSVSTPKKGDFVFFITYKPGPSHAGIYTRDNKFIHVTNFKQNGILDIVLYHHEKYHGTSPHVS
ncbi:C40 family peptidase [Niallia endozanthoxylica]|uniref:NlpC/P60 family protein n=1 Tax=Niallia endozanthoxylica TaxID=2036016 RepID=A0A5J5I8I9_9BACI|nr:NlpC/P60 family protein [Niallia endozanthoxylica]KAA9032430.1 NlpC/P60 family protein [Niallia endozanthoxylica]